MTFKEEIKKPFNFVVLSLAIFSLVLSVIFYYNGKRVRDISYQINEPISKIFDNENATPAVKLIESDSIPITDNVYILTGTIWNSGNLPILKEDVRDQISIELKSCKRLLDFKIVKQYDSSIAKFSLSRSNKNILNVDWVYFDPKFGFSFQIMYTGKEDPGFQLNGKVLDVSSFTKTKSSKNESISSHLLVIILYSILIILNFWMIMVKKNQKKPIEKVYIITLVLSIAILTLYIMTKFIWPTDPPF